MLSLPVPAASLRARTCLPARRAPFRALNHLISFFLFTIGEAIFGAKSIFLPEGREVGALYGCRGGLQPGARRMLALCSGMPVSSKHTRAKAATPARMSSLDGNAKQSRRCDLVSLGLHDHSGPGLKAIPALAAGATSLVTSTRSGNFSQRKMTP